MELKDVLQALRSGWWLLLIGALVGVGGGGLLVWQTTPTYTSSTQLFVSTGSEDKMSAYQGNLASQQRVTSYVQLLTGTKLSERVGRQLGLSDAPAELAASISASAMPNTVLLDVTVVRNSPTEARDLAVSVGEQFIALVEELENPSGAGEAPVTVTVTEEPQVASSPTTPRPLRTALVGALVGLLLGAGAVVLRSRLDNKVRTPEDVRATVGAGVVGALVESSEAELDRLISDQEGYSELAEAYRQLRTNMQFIDVDNPARSILVTSSLPAEGKTTVAVNLANVLAQSGARVLLIEADLRRPRVTRYLGLVSGAGLSNVLAGTARYEELVQPVGDGKLTVLAAGPMPPNPSEMLGSQQMRTLLTEAGEWNDFIIIDAPPLLPVTDAAVLSVATDGALLVARHGCTTKPQLEQAAESLSTIDAKLMGVVLNRIPPRAAEGYGYGYQYSYAASNEDGDGLGSQARRRQPVIVDHTTMIPVVRDDGRTGRRVRR